MFVVVKWREYGMEGVCSGVSGANFNHLTTN